MENHVSLAISLVSEALLITERLLHDSEFFTKTYGAVLNDIGQHYNPTELLDDDDLTNLRDKLAPIRLMSGVYPRCSEGVYMTCYPAIRQINIETDVRSSFFWHSGKNDTGLTNCAVSVAREDQSQREVGRCVSNRRNRFDRETHPGRT